MPASLAVTGSMIREWTPFSRTSILWEVSERITLPFTCQLISGVGKPLTLNRRQQRPQWETHRDGRKDAGACFNTLYSGVLKTIHGSTSITTSQLCRKRKQQSSDEVFYLNRHSLNGMKYKTLNEKISHPIYQHLTNVALIQPITILFSIVTAQSKVLWKHSSL